MRTPKPCGAVQPGRGESGLTSQPARSAIGAPTQKNAREMSPPSFWSFSESAKPNSCAICGVEPTNNSTAQAIGLVSACAETCAAAANWASPRTCPCQVRTQDVLIAVHHSLRQHVGW